MFPAAHEVMGSHSWQSQKSGLGLCLNDWFLRANNLDCWRASWRRKAFGCACEWFKAIMVHWQLYGLLKTGLLNDSGEPGINGTNPTGVYELARSPMPDSEPGAAAAPSDFI